MLKKHIIGELSRFLEGAQTFLTPLEIADYAFCLHKKITSRTIRKSSVSIVNISHGKFFAFSLDNHLGTLTGLRHRLSHGGGS